MKVVTLVFVINAACVSPQDQHVGSTEVYKIPCAGLRYEEVVANPFKEAQGAASASPAATTAEPVEKAAQPPRYEYGAAKKKAPRKAGRCGSKKTVWYWKGGRKKWRCR